MIPGDQSTCPQHGRPIHVHIPLGILGLRYTPELFEHNQQWARHLHETDPTYFDRIAESQHPNYLWIGCADSRVPPNLIVGLEPGEGFVHRNIANVVSQGDGNVLSVLQYAVDELKVEHIIVCGHYGCGGVRASLGPPQPGPLGLWLDHVAAVRRRHAVELEQFEGETRLRRLCELNAAAQVRALAETEIVNRAWDRDQQLFVHGWIYDMETGLMNDLGVDVEQHR